MTNTEDTTAAVTIVHQSIRGLPACLEAVTPQVAKVIIVCNGVIDHRIPQLTKGSNLEVISNENNLGVGRALNQGFELARRLGHKFALALDQDSWPEQHMVAHLLSNARPGREVDQRNPAIVAPNVFETQAQMKARFLRPRRYLGLFDRTNCLSGTLSDVTIVISSGALFDLEIHSKLGGFMEDYIVDYVDTEYCLRARRRGYEIIVACDAKLYHHWGNSRQVKFMGMTTRPTFHSPMRWYYIGRNRIPTIRKYGLRFPHWLMFDLTMAVWWFVRMLLFEDQRLRKVKATILGTWDGLMGRMGPSQRAF